jgi:hypothetical protein
LLPIPPHGVQTVSGQTDSGVNPAPETWYRFRIEVDDVCNRTNIRANVRAESTAEPAGFKIDAFDDGDNRITSGTIGIWAMRDGGKYFDDLQVLRGSRLLENAETVPSGPRLAEWTEIGARNRFEEEYRIPFVHTVHSGSRNTYSQAMHVVHERYQKQSKSSTSLYSGSYSS